MLSITNVVVGPIQTNCWLLSDTDAASTVVVDPGDRPEQILAAVGSNKVELVVLTHRHDDHRSALPGVVDATGAPVAAHELDAPGAYLPIERGMASGPAVASMDAAAREGRRAPRGLVHGDKVRVGAYEFEVMHTPGHTRGCICLYCPAEKVLITGDTLFAGGSYGRTDLEGGSPEQMAKTLMTCFAGIPDDVTLYPGHGPTSTLGRERMLNPYLR